MKRVNNSFIGCKIPTSEKQIIEKIAIRESLDISDIIRRAIRHYIYEETRVKS